MPLSFLINADQHDFVFVPVDSVDDILCRLQGDFVFGRSAARIVFQHEFSLASFFLDDDCFTA